VANDDFDTRAATTLRKYAKTLEDNFFESRPLLAWLESRKQDWTGGRTIVQPLMYAGNDTVGSYSDYDVLPITAQAGISAAEFVSSQYAGAVNISGREEYENRGAEQVISLLDAKVTQLEESLGATFSSHLITNGTSSTNQGRTGVGNSGKDCIGLMGIVDSDTYPWLGGIDGSQAENLFWNAYIDDNGGTSIPLALSAINLAYQRVGDGSYRPDLLLTSEDLYLAILETLQPNQVFENPKMASIGFDSIAYMGLTIMADPDVPDGNCILTSSKHLNLRTIGGRWFSFTDFVRPERGDSRSSQCLSAFQLTTGNRRRHGLISNRTAN
jgi:hypothetical protein